MNPNTKINIIPTRKTKFLAKYLKGLFIILIYQEYQIAAAFLATSDKIYKNILTVTTIAPTGKL